MAKSKKPEAYVDPTFEEFVERTLATDPSLPQNQRNMKRPAHNTSGYKGVSWSKATFSWYAYIQHNGRTINLGRYSTAKEAHAVYVQAAEKCFGEFARAG